MSSGFIKLNRTGGLELLGEDLKAFALLTQIALRARREEGKYSRHSLKANQAFIGDYEKIGLSRQAYRSAQKRLTKYGLAIFEPTNQGTIATLMSIDIYDINANEEPSNSSMEIMPKEPSNNHQETIQEPSGNQPTAIQTPLTRMKEREECKKETTSASCGDLYLCLQSCSSLSAKEKKALMQYPEKRVAMAMEWTATERIKTTLIQALVWHCQQPNPPSRRTPSKTEQELAALEFNTFLQEHGYHELAEKNQEAIPQNRVHIISGGRETTISLQIPIQTVQQDLKASKDDILAMNRRNSTQA